MDTAEPQERDYLDSEYWEYYSIITWLAGHYKLLLRISVPTSPFQVFLPLISFSSLEFIIQALLLTSLLYLTMLRHLHLNWWLQCQADRIYRKMSPFILSQGSQECKVVAEMGND